MKNILLIGFTLLCTTQLWSQQDQVFTRADSLRGALSPLRTCYDVTYYHLDVRVDPKTRSIRGSNEIRFRVVSDFNRMQIDLYDNLKIEKIELDDGRKLGFTREFAAVFVALPEKLREGTLRSIKVHYSGQPTIAKRPPWESGFSWEKDPDGNPWVVVTCEGEGASLWWPNKDHGSDEPDSMLISITAPPGLTDISNGRLRVTKKLADGWTRYDWFVANPINNYNVTFNIGKYAHFREWYDNGSFKLSLDYYVLPQNLAKAREHFKQVHGMMKAFEHYFGPYPFPEDGFKLIESPHLGMEHQSAVAYGNWYLGGYRGRAPADVGLKFDFIIVHETAHEWWGNSVSANDHADLWIHESFGAYAEALYIEYHWGYAEALKYINGKKRTIQYDRPIIGPHHVNRSGSGDMYNKGQLILNTLRNALANDSLWFAVIKGLAQEFRHQSIDGADVFDFINTTTGQDFSYFFDQYFSQVHPPELQIHLSRKGDVTTMRYRWGADVENFRMPVKVTTSKGKFSLIYPTTVWKSMELGDLWPDDFQIADDLFLIRSRMSVDYLDPRRPD